MLHLFPTTGKTCVIKVKQKTGHGHTLSHISHCLRQYELEFEQ